VKSNGIFYAAALYIQLPVYDGDEGIPERFAARTHVEDD